MEPRIEFLDEKILVGKSLEMSLNTDKTVDLWRSFMPNLKDIKNKIGDEKYSVRVYPNNYFLNVDFSAHFIKWAAVEVSKVENLPHNFTVFNLEAGKYAVFTYKGKPSESANFFKMIYVTWLEKSEYKLDNRPHFEVLGLKYKNEDPASEEEIWIPIRRK